MSASVRALAMCQPAEPALTLPPLPAQADRRPCCWECHRRSRQARVRPRNGRPGDGDRASPRAGDSDLGGRGSTAASWRTGRPLAAHQPFQPQDDEERWIRTSLFTKGLMGSSPSSGSERPTPAGPSGAAADPTRRSRPGQRSPAPTAPTPARPAASATKALGPQAPPPWSSLPAAHHRSRHPPAFGITGQCGQPPSRKRTDSGSAAGMRSSQPPTKPTPVLLAAIHPSNASTAIPNGQAM